MKDKWLKIYDSTEDFKIEIIKGLLIDNEINSVLINKKDSGLKFGVLELYVQAENVVRAKYLINKFNDE